MQYIVTTANWALVDANSSVTFQVVGPQPVEVGLSNNTTSPGAGILYTYLQGDRGTLSEVFPGVSGNCVWARSSANSVLTIGQS